MNVKLLEGEVWLKQLRTHIATDGVMDEAKFRMNEVGNVWKNEESVKV